MQRDESIPALFADAVVQAKEVARTEIDLQKARLLAKVGKARSAVAYLVGAVVCGHLALIGLVVGMLLILERIVGPAVATVIVVGTLLSVASVTGWLAFARFKVAFGAAAPR